MKRALILVSKTLIFFILFVVFALAPHIGAQADPATEAKIAADVQEALTALPDGQVTTVIVTLVDQVDKKQFKGQKHADRQKAAVKALKDKANKSQKQIIKYLKNKQKQGEVEKYDSFWVLNGLSVTATQAVIQEMAARSDVLKITADDITIVPTFAQTTVPVEANLALVQAPALWDAGFYGQGIVVANMDSGVDLNHPELSSRWRGGSNSWFDPYGQNPMPTDFSGHGTWTMGVMVGAANSGSAIGVAPQAQWIAVKIFDNSGGSTATAIHQGFQWLMDPDGDSNTADAPHVVNNSWAMGSPGCDLEFELDLSSLLAAGIVPVFAAGNFGPNNVTSTSPANNPSAFAVGGVNNGDLIMGNSSRGPANCGESTTIFPELVAPGNGIRTTERFGLYTTASGTSLAAPHVAGGMALLLSAFPDLPPAWMETALISGAVDLGLTGPDNDYGNGRLDLLASYQWLQNNPGPPSPTPTATATDTPLPPTATATATAVPPTATATATDTPLPPTPTATATAVPPTATATATIVPPTATIVSSDSIFSDGFESGDFSAWTAVVDSQQDLAVTSAAALVGSKGVAALIDNRTAMYLRDDSPLSESRYWVHFAFDPNSIRMKSGDYHSIMAARSSSTEVIRLDFRYSGGTYQVRGRVNKDGGGYITTSWYDISDAPHAIELDWQAATSVGANNGYLSLWVDNVLQQIIDQIDNDQNRIEEVRLGPLSGIDLTTVGTELFDDFVSRRNMTTPSSAPTDVPPTATATSAAPTATATATGVPPAATATPTAVPPTATTVPPTATTVPPTATIVSSDLIFSDGFESGDFSAWTVVVDSQQDLAVTSAAALVGGKGVAALIDNRTAMYLRDDSPLSESRYWVHFAFDPNSVKMKSGDYHSIMAARSSSTEVIRLDFRYSGGTYQVRGRVNKDGGGYITTSWYDISDAPHAIEFDWQAATSVGANNGYLSLWVDNVLQQTIGQIDNDQNRIEEVRLGPLSGIDLTTAGTELFDDFVSRRANPSGL